MNRIHRMVPGGQGAGNNPVHPAHPVQTAEAFIPCAEGGQDCLAGSLVPEVPTSLIKPACPRCWLQALHRTRHCVTCCSRQVLYARSFG